MKKLDVCHLMPCENVGVIIEGDWWQQAFFHGSDTLGDADGEKSVYYFGKIRNEQILCKVSTVVLKDAGHFERWWCG